VISDEPEFDRSGRSGREDVLSVEDWAEIRRLHFAEGLSIKTISKQMSVARNTVRTAIRSASAGLPAPPARIGGRTF
jgi:predicted DNA-binding protein (UPF0251 family)